MITGRDWQVIYLIYNTEHIRPLDEIAMCIAVNLNQNYALVNEIVYEIFSPIDGSDCHRGLEHVIKQLLHGIEAAERWRISGHVDFDYYMLYQEITQYLCNNPWIFWQLDFKDTVELIPDGMMIKDDEGHLIYRILNTTPTINITSDEIVFETPDGHSRLVFGIDPTISVSVNPANTAEPINSEEVIAFLDDRWEP